MHVWLASYPRSGNTFFRIILSDRYGIGSSDGPAIPPESWGSLRRIEASLRPNTDPDGPQFSKTHNLPPADADPAIYIVRDGRDAVVSYAHFILSFVKKPGEVPAADPGAAGHDPFWIALRDLLLEERSPYGTWAQNVLAWMARPNTVVVRYEDLVRDPLPTADRALVAIGLSLKPIGSKVPSFDELKAVDPKFFRQGTKGSHRREFPADLLQLFWERNGEAMRRLGYARGRPVDFLRTLLDRISRKVGRLTRPWGTRG